MSDKTLISWSDATWNPTTGCTQVSPGCAHCYAKTLTERFGGVFENVILHPDRLDKPLRWKKPRRIFVNSMSDLFHEDIPDEYIDQVFAVMELAYQHTYLILTKRIERAGEYLADRRDETWDALWKLKASRPSRIVVGAPDLHRSRWPLPNVLIGPTVENLHFAQIRLPITQRLHDLGWRTMVSYEPALTAVDFEQYLGGIDWLICGGESGAKRRPFNHAWARSALQQAREAGVPFFMKQDGALRSEVYDTLPDDLKVRQFP